MFVIYYPQAEQLFVLLLLQHFQQRIASGGGAQGHAGSRQGGKCSRQAAFYPFSGAKQGDTRGIGPKEFQRRLPDRLLQRQEAAAGGDLPGGEGGERLFRQREGL